MGGSTANWFMELTEKQPFWPSNLQGPSFRKRSMFFHPSGLAVSNSSFCRFLK